MQGQQLHYINRINYFSAIDQLKQRMPPQNLRTYLSQVLKDEPNNFHPSSPTEQELNSEYLKICPKRQVEIPSFKQTFDEYLNAVKLNLPTDKYVAFLRYLSLYIAGKLPHDVFIRLFLNFFRGENLMNLTVIQYLPSFLSSLSCSTFFTHKINLPAAIQDKFAVETLMNITSSISSTQVSKTVSKCLTCLSIGLISKDIAKDWLSHFFKPEIIEKLDEIDDFSYLHPSRFPHELILCPEFSSTDNSTSICQQFVEYEASLKPFSTYKPAVRELCEVKMRGLRKAIRKLADGIKLTPDELFFAYGNYAYSVADLVLDCSSLILEHLGDAYEQTQQTLFKILHHQMKQFEPSNPEFRYTFKRLLKHETYAFHYQLPGSRKIDFGKRSAANVAFSIVYDFSNSFFKEKEAKIIKRGLNLISALINPENMEKVYVVDEKQIFVIVYLAAIARLALEAGNTDEVLISPEGSIVQMEQTSEFGKKLILLPKQVKTPEGLRDFFPEFAFQHIDLHITRAVRQLIQLDDELPEYPEELSSSYIITTMQQHEDETGFSITCTSAFSPCFIEFAPDNSDESSMLGFISDKEI
ncbi:hypothetical protein TRFO_21612 [Tritrichomonas foetus]|uniref:Uncharacterized protein n=1 Tax=Tritrichomonas foetus TaxID=1144522 RepID=A0A1J4KD84_9EUKA|nr:hypothetical protein TRFO_21612 [Tritrichomonas foetus]|eukprot:OHT09399.1 hypothetical protein TRFO_21612 [Tritrichomonas foetus]